MVKRLSADPSEDGASSRAENSRGASPRAPKTAASPGTVRPEFAPYLKLVDFLGALLGPRSEIVLHDLSDLNRSIIALANSHISGRSIGGPATDLVLKILHNKDYLHHDYLANYLAYSRTGEAFRSSTFFIRGSDGSLIGMLCLNIDDGPLVEARNLLAAITSTTGLLKTGAEGNGDGATGNDASAHSITENLSTNVDELTLDGITRIVAEQGIEPRRMTQREKIKAVEQLNDSGLFLLKGAVAQAALALQVSEPSMYRYLKLARQK